MLEEVKSGQYILYYHPVRAFVEKDQPDEPLNPYVISIDNDKPRDSNIEIE